MPLIAHWIFLQLPSCGPGFESQANHLRYFSQILYYTCHCIEKRTKINKNMGLDIFKIKIQPYHNGTSFMCSFQSLQNPMTLELSWEKLHKIAVFYIKNISVKVILFRYLGIFESLNTSKKTSIPTPTRIPLQQLRVCSTFVCSDKRVNEHYCLTSGPLPTPSTPHPSCIFEQQSR